MILRFGVANHKSIKNYQEISFVASSLRDTSTDLLRYRKISVLPTLAVYGANASGKSNLLDALDEIQRHILQSQTHLSRNQSIPQQPFKSNPKKRIQSKTTFDIDFVLDDTRYHYGFEFDKTKYLKEWLYAYPKAKRQVLFYRTIPLNPKTTFTSAPISMVAQQRYTVLRPNSLILSTMSQIDHEQLSPIYNFFRKDRFRIVLDIDINYASIIKAFQEKDFAPPP